MSRCRLIALSVALAIVVGDVVAVIGCSRWIVGGRRLERLRPGR